MALRDTKSGRFKSDDVFDYDHHFATDNPFDNGGRDEPPAVAKRREAVRKAQAGDPGLRSERIQARNELSTAHTSSGPVSAESAQHALNRQQRFQRGQAMYRRTIPGTKVSLPLIGSKTFVGNDPEDPVEHVVRKLRGR